MGLYPFIVLIVVFGLSARAGAEENENAIEIQTPRKLEGKHLIPIETSIQNANVRNGAENKNSEKVPAGQPQPPSKILMVVGHTKNDELNFNPESALNSNKESDSVESLAKRKRRSHHHGRFGGSCHGGCGMGGGGYPGGGYGGESGEGGHAGSFSSAQSSASSSSWSEGGGGHHRKMGYGKK